MRDTWKLEPVDGFELTASILAEFAPDTSWLGEFSDTAESGAIDHEATDTWLERSWQGPKYFNPANPDYAKQDYKRLVDYYQGGWSLVGIQVTASKAGIELGSDSLWGIESDSSEDFFHETAAELVVEAIEQAKAKLKELVAVSQIAYGDMGHQIGSLPLDVVAARKYLDKHGVDRIYMAGGVKYRRETDPNGKPDYIPWHGASQRTQS